MANVAHSTLTGANLHEPKGVASASSGEVYVADGSGSGDWTTLGDVAQIVHSQSGAVGNTTTQIPLDDTIPQNTEGAEFLTASITPTNASSNLRIDVILNVSANGAAHIIGALFKSGTANALAVSPVYVPTSGAMGQIKLTYYASAGSTAAATYTFRAGPSASAQITVNGAALARLFGGVSASSITITEYLP